MALGSGSTLLSDIVRRFTQTQAAFFVLALGLAVSFAAWRFADQRVGGEAAREFQQKTARAVEAMDRRIQDNIDLLIGLQGLFIATEDVSREDFRLYLSRFNIELRFPGIRSISYSQRVLPAQKPAFEALMRRDTSIGPLGFPEFKIKPPGERGEYIVIRYVEPLASNRDALGLDINFDDVRRAEMARIRDSGGALATDPFPAVVDPKQVSFAVRTAVYRPGMPLQTVAQRRLAFQGVVAMLLHPNELMGSLLGTQFGSAFDLVIHDVGALSAAHPGSPAQWKLVFDSRQLSGAAPKLANNELIQEVMLEVAGRKWRLQFSPPARALGAEQMLPIVVLLGGVVTSLLLFWLIWALSVARARAIKIADQATAARNAEVLREQLDFIQQLIEAVPQPIFFKDAGERRYLGVNKAWEKFFGIPREQFVGKTVFDLYPDNRELAQRHHAKDQELFGGPGSQTYEAEIVAADGNTHHTIYNKATFNKPDGSVAGLIGTITDVSGLKEAEAALRESEARFRSLTGLSSDWYWEQDQNFRFVEITRRDTSNAGTGAAHRYIGKTRWETGLEIVGTTWEEHRAALEARRPFRDVLFRRQHPDGGVHHTAMSGEPVYDAAGVFRGYRGVGQDITARKREERLLALEHAVTRCLAEADSAPAALEAAIRAVCETESWECGRYFSPDEKSGVMRFGMAWGVPHEAVERYIAGSRDITYAPGVGLMGRVWQSGQPLWVSDLYKDARVSQPTLARESGIHGAFVFPVITEGKTIGVLAFNSREVRQPEERLLQAISVIGSQIGQFLQRKQAEEVLRESEARFRDLTELSSDWYWEQDADLRFTQVSSKVPEFSLDAQGQIGRTRWEMSLLGVTDEQWQAHRSLLAAHQPFRDFVYQRSDVNGQLRTISVNGRPIFDERGRFMGYRGTAKDVTEQRQVEEQIRHMAHHDALTGLPNRVLLHDRIGQAIAQAQRNGKVAALLFIDLDRFKNVNDSLGHEVGDHLLRAVAERLVACTRGTDTVARVGGDEFVVVLTDLDEPNDAGPVAGKVLEALSQPLNIEKHELQITPSVGICAYPHDGEDIETLMRNADAAMYHAKKKGRNNYQFFTQQMNVAAQQRLLLENDLRRAVEREEFILHYQPQLDLGTGDIVGFEALIRWPHPQRGMVAPSEFIPVAEETGLINPIGEWVLREACSQVCSWRGAGYLQLRASVNCSAQQFRLEGIVETVSSTLRQTGLPAACLGLELTESVIIEHAEQVTARFTVLHEMGVQLSIDDFGTGYSSLSYLKRLPIQELKIDQSFVRDISSDPDDAAIITAIIAMAHSLGLEVVAEGVETAEQLAFLKSLGCDRAQGNYFSRPLPAGEFLQLLHGWNPQARAVGA